MLKAFCLLLSSGLVASQSSDPPYWPSIFKMQFDGIYTITGWQYSGYMYYSDPAKHWRFDEVFLYDAELIAKFPTLTDEIAEFDFANETTVLSYHMSPTTFEWSCDVVPVPQWWAPDYLYFNTTSYVGVKIVNGIECDEYATTDVWPSSTIFTYISQADQSFVRLYFDQPFNSFNLNIIDMVPQDSMADSTWNIPSAVQAAAPEC